MKPPLEQFIETVNEFELVASSNQIDYFVFFLTVDLGQKSATATEVKECFEELGLIPYSNISQYLSSNSKNRRGKRAKFVKKSNTYTLERLYKNSLKRLINKLPEKQHTTVTLNSLEKKLKSAGEKTYFHEALNCYEIGAFRASIIMIWILTLDHLFQYVMKYKLSDFNSALGKNKDRRVKISVVQNRDDFGEIPEYKFIEFCRSSKIISADVRKILDEKLGTRNTCAHPSTIIVSPIKASDFIQDLVTNVILKYNL